MSEGAINAQKFISDLESDGLLRIFARSINADFRMGDNAHSEFACTTKIRCADCRLRLTDASLYRCEAPTNIPFDVEYIDCYLRENFPEEYI